MPALSQETAMFLRNLLTSQQIAVGAPDFLEVTERVTTALVELDAVLEEHATAATNPVVEPDAEGGTFVRLDEGALETGIITADALEVPYLPDNLAFIEELHGTSGA